MIYSSPTIVPSEALDWNQPSTSRSLNSCQSFSLDFVKELQAKARFHERESKRKDRLIQRHIQEKKELKRQNIDLQNLLSLERKKFKSLRNHELTESERHNILRDCLKPFFKSTQIGIYKAISH